MSNEARSLGRRRSRQGLIGWVYASGPAIAGTLHVSDLHTPSWPGDDRAPLTTRSIFIPPLGRGGVEDYTSRRLSQ